MIEDGLDRVISITARRRCPHGDDVLLGGKWLAERIPQLDEVRYEVKPADQKFHWVGDFTQGNVGTIIYISHALRKTRVVLQMILETISDGITIRETWDINETLPGAVIYTQSGMEVPWTMLDLSLPLRRVPRNECSVLSVRYPDDMWVSGAAKPSDLPLIRECQIAYQRCWVVGWNEEELGEEGAAREGVKTIMNLKALIEKALPSNLAS